MRSVSVKAIDLYTLFPLTAGSELAFLDCTPFVKESFPLTEVELSSLPLDEPSADLVDCLWVPELRHIDERWIRTWGYQALKADGRLLLGIQQRPQSNQDICAYSWAEIEQLLPLEQWMLEQAYLVRYSLEEPRFLIPLLNQSEAWHYDRFELSVPYSFPAFLRYWWRTAQATIAHLFQIPNGVTNNPIIVVWVKKDGGHR